MTDETKRQPETHTVWVSEKQRIASFHAAESYAAQTFVNRDFFMDYLRSLQERGFRFQ